MFFKHDHQESYHHRGNFQSTPQITEVGIKAIGIGLIVLIVTISQRIVDALILPEMVKLLSDLITVAFANIVNGYSKDGVGIGGIYIVWIIRYYVVKSINTELWCSVTKSEVRNGTMIEGGIIVCNVKVTVEIHKETVVIRKQKIAW